MQKLYHFSCPKCNNKLSFYRYGKDPDGYQKYQCRNCWYQFAPERPRAEGANCGRPPRPEDRKHPSCPMCAKASFLHHDHEHYSNYRCCDKRCDHSFFIWKNTAITAPSMSTLFGKHNFKRMRYPVHLIITALSMFFLGKNSFRNISLILRTVFNIKVSHVTISNWCTKFAPMFDNMRIKLLPFIDLNSDEWHGDETYVKINGVQYYLWFVIDAETRFIVGFNLSEHRDSAAAVAVMNEVKNCGNPKSIVTDRYAPYRVPVKTFFPEAKHIRVESFKDDISNNLIECFNKQFKAWYKTKQGFCSFKSANNLISMFVFFFNFVRPHSALNSLTPAQVAGLKLSNKQKRLYPLVA